MPLSVAFARVTDGVGPMAFSLPLDLVNIADQPHPEAQKRGGVQTGPGDGTTEHAGDTVDDGQ